MKFPSRLGLALGTLVTGLVGLSLEVQMSHPLHVISVLVGGFVLFLIHPQEGGVIAGAPIAPPQSSRTPDGAVPAVPPETI
jgi:hypothetical protein